MPIIPVLIAAIIAIGGGTAALADSAKPGDALYPVDQWIEGLQNRLAFSEEAKAGLVARLSEERAEELADLLDIDPAQLSEEMQARFEEHRQEALGRVALSIEKAEAIRDRFEEKLSEAEDENQAKAFQIVIDRMDEIITRRELKIDDIQNRYPQGPTTGQKEIREQIREFMGENYDLFEQIHEEIADEFGVEFPTIAPNPYPIRPEFDDQLPEEWRQLQEEMRRMRQRITEEIRQKIENGEIEWEDEDHFPGEQLMNQNGSQDDEDSEEVEDESSDDSSDDTQNQYRRGQ